MVLSMLIFVLAVRFLATQARVNFNGTAGSKHSTDSNETCIRNVEARVLIDPRTKMVTMQINWSVGNRYVAMVTGFRVEYVSERSYSGSKSLGKNDRSYSISIPGAIPRLEKYIVHVQCSSFGEGKSIDVGGKDICAAFNKSNFRAPFHCLEKLRITNVRKCKDKNVTISWQDPYVKGYSGYLVKVAKVSCEQEKGVCCKHANYSNMIPIRKELPSHVTIPNMEEEGQYCIQVLMCPDGSGNKLNCEAKHLPILISCLKKKLNFHPVVEKSGNLLFIVCCCCTLVLLFVVILCLLLWRYKKRKRNRSRNCQISKDEWSKNESELVRLEECKNEDPLLFIAYCAGCTAVEDYVLHLTQFFRLNGVDAVSELTQENAIINQGRGVFLNKMLSEAKFVLVLCTDVGEDIQLQNSYTCTINAIQNKIVEYGANLSQYFMVHFNQIDNIPSILRPASIDISDNHALELENIIRRIYGFLSYSIDKFSIQKNEVHLSDKALAKADELSATARKIMTPKHIHCFQKSCQKGKR